LDDEQSKYGRDRSEHGTQPHAEEDTQAAEFREGVESISRGLAGAVQNDRQQVLPSPQVQGRPAQGR